MGWALTGLTGWVLAGILGQLTRTVFRAHRRAVRSRASPALAAGPRADF